MRGELFRHRCWDSDVCWSLHSGYGATFVADVLVPPGEAARQHLIESDRGLIRLRWMRVAKPQFGRLEGDVVLQGDEKTRVAEDA